MIGIYLTQYFLLCGFVFSLNFLIQHPTYDRAIIITSITETIPVGDPRVFVTSTGAPFTNISIGQMLTIIFNNVGYKG